MQIFKKIEKNLEGATRGQSFVWEVYGIFWSNLPPLVFGMLAVNSECGFFTIGLLFENHFIWCSVFNRIAKTDP